MKRAILVATIVLLALPGWAEQRYQALWIQGGPMFLLDTFTGKAWMSAVCDETGHGTDKGTGTDMLSATIADSKAYNLMRCWAPMKSGPSIPASTTKK